MPRRLQRTDPRRARKTGATRHAGLHRTQAAAAALLPEPGVGRCQQVPRRLPELLPRYYTSGDGGYIDEDGYVFVMGEWTM